MSLYLRLVIGPVVVCDVELFGTVTPAEDETPPQLNGGQGMVLEPCVDETVIVPDPFGFGR